MKRERVLVVDDDPVQLQIVRAWLEADGFEVTTMDTPFGATAVVLRERPQVVLLDVTMPGLDGHSLAEAMRRGRTAETSIIFYSGRSRSQLAELAQRHGAIGFIEKTVDGDEFLGQFRCLLMSRRRAS